MKTLDRLAETLEALEPSIQVEICLDLVARCREVTVRARELEHRIRSLVQTHAAALLQIPGCAALAAAKIVAETARADRFPTEGTSPATRERLRSRSPREPNTGSGFNRRGNRQLNAAIHRIAVTQLRIHAPARSYMEKKRAEARRRRRPFEVSNASSPDRSSGR